MTGDTLGRCKFLLWSFSDRASLVGDQLGNERVGGTVENVSK